MASSENRRGRNSRERESSSRHAGGDYRRGDHRGGEKSDKVDNIKKESDGNRDERSDRPRDRSPISRSDRNAGSTSNKNLTFEEALEISKKKVASRCRLFVGNLSNEIKEADLRQLFEPYGEVTECFMSGKGFGFVRLETRARAEMAKENLDGHSLKGRPIRVRYAVHGASVRVKEINPCISNELLAQAFSIFGEVERAVHILDGNSQPTGEGIVEFERKPGAVDALRRINEGVFLLSHNPRPIVVEPLEPRDDEDGLSEKMLPKSGMFQNQPVNLYRERSQPPRFAIPGSFEFEFGNRWKELYHLERLKREQLEREFKDAREKLEGEMELAYQEYQTAQLREDLRRRQEELERLEAARRERIEMLRMRDEERNRARQQEQQQQQQQQQNFRNFGAPPPFNMPPMNQNALMGNNATQQRMHEMRPNEFNAPPRSDEQLVHGVQKLMQMMQHSNQNRATFPPPAGLPPPPVENQSSMGMPIVRSRPNLLNLPPNFAAAAAEDQQGDGRAVAAAAAAIWKNNHPHLQPGGRNFFR